MPRLGDLGVRGLFGPQRVARWSPDKKKKNPGWRPVPHHLETDPLGERVNRLISRFHNDYARLQPVVSGALQELIREMSLPATTRRQHRHVFAGLVFPDLVEKHVTAEGDHAGVSDDVRRRRAATGDHY